MKFLTAVRLAATILLAALILGPPTLLAVPFRQSVRSRIMFYPFWAFAYLTRYLYSAKVTVAGREFTGGRFGRGHLYVSNHLSLADTPLLVSVYPQPFMAKRETVKVPIIGQAGYMSGNILFDRADPEARKRALRLAVERIRELRSIYVFPEGTRSKTGVPKNEPHLGMMLAAWDENIPVVPIAIYGSQRLLRTFSAKVTIKYSAPLQPRDFATREGFARACWGRVLEMFYELKAAADGTDPSPVSAPAGPALSDIASDKAPIETEI
jgi:1-acyl-sn-glycerol-3-phosphate acyltransferase